MKKSVTFAASSPKTILRLIVVVVFFIATNTALNAANNRLPIFNGYHATKPVIVFGEMKKGSLSSFNTLIFRYMPKTTNNYSTENSSNRNVTPTERNAVPYSKFLIEKNCKNQAYFFILSHGLLEQFEDFCNNNHSSNPHKDCIDYLLSKI